ncbi:MAG: hypothetical protein Q9168_007387 [Polycauliona sp. 1 TL-2023]
MAGPITSLNLSSIYHWHELETEGSFIYSLSPEQIQNGTIDPYLLAATTLLHLLVSVSRRLLNTNISPFEYALLSICIIAATIEEGAFLLLLVYGKDNTSPFFKTFKASGAMPTSTLENLARLAAKPGVQSTLVLSASDGSIIKSTGLLAESAIPSSPDAPPVGNNSSNEGKPSSTSLPNDSHNLYGREESRTRTAEHVAKMVFNFVAAAKDFARGIDEGDDAKLLRMRTRKQEIVIVPDDLHLKSSKAEVTISFPATDFVAHTVRYISLSASFLVLEIDTSIAGGMEKGDISGDHPNQSGEPESRSRSATKLHDPSITFEEYYYHAHISRAHPSESPNASSSTPTNGLSRFLPFRKNDASPAIDDAAMNEKSSDASSPAQSWHNVSDEERIMASRALRTATWGAVFYLITTDILGPFTTAWAFSQMGYAPASILYCVFGIFAAYGGVLLWKMFLQLDSDRYPLRCYGDIAYRVAGSVARHIVNIVQSIQLLFLVGIIIIQNGQGLSQISKGSVCFIILCFVWAIAGAFLGQIRTLRRLGWLAHAAIWLNVLILIVTTAVVFHSDPNYDAALANNDAEKGPKVTTAGPPEGVGFEGQVVGLMQAVYSYGGAMLFVEFMAEMKRPYDFWKAMVCAQTFIFSCYMLFGFLIYSQQGQFTINPNYQGVSPYAWQTAVNSIALVTTLIAALLYGNIGIKVLYSNILMEFFGFPSLARKTGKLLWVAIVPIYWGLAFVVAAAIPSISNLSGLIAAVCILQFSYTFPPLLMLFHCAQRDAIQEGIEGFDPATGQTTRRDSGMSRWMRGLRKKPVMNGFNLFFFLGSLATAVLGIYSAVIGLKNAYAETAVSGFSCTSPIGA